MWQCTKPFCQILPQNHLNVINAIILILHTYLNLLCVWKYVDITSRSTAVVWRLRAYLEGDESNRTQIYGGRWLYPQPIQKFFDFTASRLCELGAFRWRWLSINMVLSFAPLTNVIVKPLIILKAAFVSVSLLLRWKLRADSSLVLGSLTKQTVDSSS